MLKILLCPSNTTTYDLEEAHSCKEIQAGGQGALLQFDPMAACFNLHKGL